MTISCIILVWSVKVASMFENYGHEPDNPTLYWSGDSTVDIENGSNYFVSIALATFFGTGDILYNGRVCQSRKIIVYLLKVTSFVGRWPRPPISQQQRIVLGLGYKMYVQLS